MAIMISIPAGITSNQASTETLTQNLSNTITQTEATINQTLAQIECSMAPVLKALVLPPPTYQIQEIPILHHLTEAQDLPQDSSVVALCLGGLAAVHSAVGEIVP